MTPASAERADDRRRGALGRQRHHGDAAMRRASSSSTASPSSERSLLGVVHAAALVVEERPFDVDAEHAGHAAARWRRAPRRWRAPTTSRSSLISVGRKPVVPKRRCARPMAAMVSTLGIVVEQHAAAAVHLRVDEAGRQQLRRRRSMTRSAPDRPRARPRRPRCGRRAPAACAPLSMPCVGEHPSVAERQQHQTVSVTLLRCGGRSGSRPRASASALAMRVERSGWRAAARCTGCAATAGSVRGAARLGAGQQHARAARGEFGRQLFDAGARVVAPA